MILIYERRNAHKNDKRTGQADQSMMLLNLHALMTNAQAFVDYHQNTNI